MNCAVCERPIPDHDLDYKENQDGERVPTHSACDFHTCEGMTAAAKSGDA